MSETEPALRDVRMASQRVFFGPRAAALETLAPAHPVLVVASKRSATLVDGAWLGAGRTVTFDGATPHNPDEVVAAARALADGLAPATIVAVGSSSAIDLGKAVRDGREATLVTMPTALGGAEMTRGYGVSHADGQKKGGMLPTPAEVVVYDPVLLASLPPRELGSIGINAWAHTIEAHYAKSAVPLGVAAAERAGRALATDLLEAVTSPDAPLRERLFESAFLAGYALNACGMALHHAVCHVLGGATRVPHGIVNAIVLPHALRANASLAPDAVRRVAVAFGVDDLAERAWRIARAYGLPEHFRELGYGEALVAEAAPRVAAAALLRNNPAPVDEATIAAVLRGAVLGTEGATSR